jgi:hypothetical protein
MFEAAIRACAPCDHERASRIGPEPASAARAHVGVMRTRPRGAAPVAELHSASSMERAESSVKDTEQGTSPSKTYCFARLSTSCLPSCRFQRQDRAACPSMAARLFKTLGGFEPLKSGTDSHRHGDVPLCFHPD